MLGTAGVRLEEELRQLKLEGQKLLEQLLETKKFLVNAGNQWESSRRQVELLNRELEDAKSQPESKTRERVRLVDEWECLARELENAEEDSRKLINRLKTEQTSRKVIQSRLEAINAQNSFSRPPNLYELLILPQGATNTTVWEDFKTLSFPCHPDNGAREDISEIILQAKNIVEDGKARDIYDKYGIEKHKTI